MPRPDPAGVQMPHWKGRTTPKKKAPNWPKPRFSVIPRKSSPCGRSGKAMQCQSGPELVGPAVCGAGADPQRERGPAGATPEFRAVPVAARLLREVLVSGGAQRPEGARPRGVREAAARPSAGGSCKHPGVAPIHTGEAVLGCCPTGQAPRCGLGRARCPHCLRRVP